MLFRLYFVVNCGAKIVYLIHNSSSIIHNFELDRNAKRKSSESNLHHMSLWFDADYTAIWRKLQRHLRQVTSWFVSSCTVIWRKLQNDLTGGKTIYELYHITKENGSRWLYNHKRGYSISYNFTQKVKLNHHIVAIVTKLLCNFAT